MTTHALKELIKYKWYAKTRHGIHSPFVYAFIEDLLYKKSKEKIASIFVIEQQAYPQLYKKLLMKVAQYYNCQQILCITDEINNNWSREQYDLVWLNMPETNNWIKTFEHIFPSLQDGSIVAISNIHQSQQHTAAWQSLYKNNKVRLSMDLYGLGLLFFKEDFKEQQHFVLKYPL